jgi:hypothetical protein
MRPVFYPLKGKWFGLVASDKKTWELRSASSPVGRALLRRTPPFQIEFRRGYSGGPVLAEAREVRVFSDPKEISEDVLSGGCVRLKDLKDLGMNGRIVAVNFRAQFLWTPQQHGGQDEQHE